MKDIFPGPTGSNPSFLTDVDGVLYFQANDGDNGDELWKSDGTASGTVLVKDIDPGLPGSLAQGLTNVNGTLYFEAEDDSHGLELWRSDGTAAGTIMVKDINPGLPDSGPQSITDVGGTVYFAAIDNTRGDELWKSDGTSNGTVLVRNIDPTSAGSNPQNLVNVNGMLFFQASDGADGYELWKSDGTPAGTIMVKDIVGSGVPAVPGFPGSSFPSNLTKVDGELYFTVHGDGAHGDELWKSDGTAVGTVMVKDIVPGTGSSSPHDLAAVNGVLEFYAFDGTSTGLFRSDGIAAGTIELATNIQDTTPFAVTETPDGDFNGNSFSDVLFQNANGQTSIWDADWSARGRRRRPSAPIPARPGKQSGAVTSTATAIPTSSGRTRAPAKPRFGN